jgi:hypothetical protein
MSDKIFKRAMEATEKYPEPSKRLEEFGIDTTAALDEAMEIAAKIIVQTHGDPFDLVCNIAALFMSGLSVGVEIPAVADAALVAEATVADQ